MCLDFKNMDETTIITKSLDMFEQVEELLKSLEELIKHMPSYREYSEELSENINLSEDRLKELEIAFIQLKIVNIQKLEDENTDINIEDIRKEYEKKKETNIQLQQDIIKLEKIKQQDMDEKLKIFKTLDNYIRNSHGFNDQRLNQENIKYDNLSQNYQALFTRFDEIKNQIDNRYDDIESFDNCLKEIYDKIKNDDLR